jgi:hypothetical protein
LGAQAGFLDELIEAGVGHGLAFDFQQAQRRFAVFGFERLLFARPGVLQIKHLPAPVEVKPFFHSRMIKRNEKHRYGVAGGFCRMVPGYWRISKKPQIFWHFFWQSPRERAFYAPAFGVCR